MEGTFTPGEGEQHTGIVMKTRKRRLREMIENAIINSINVKPQLLQEISYTKFGKQVSTATPTQQMSKSYRMISKKLKEATQLLEYTMRLKGQLSESETKSHSKMKEQIEDQIKSLFEVYNTLHK